MPITRVASILLASSLILVIPSTAHVAWLPNGFNASTTVGGNGNPGQYIGANSSLVMVVDSGGVSVAQASSVGFYEGTSDGSGGLVLVSAGADITAHRFDGSASPLWGSGVIVCNAPNVQLIPAVSCDAANNSFFTWLDYRSFPGAGGSREVFAQRVSPFGVTLWATNGVLITDVGADPLVLSMLTITPDGTGGCVVVWEDRRAGVMGPADLRAQRIDASGNAVWAANGILVAEAAGTQKNAAAIPVASGVMVSWMDNRSGTYDIYAQVLDLTGAPQWTANGIVVCAAASDEGEIAMEPDGSGGGYVAWTDYRTSGTTGTDIYAQRVTGSGTPLWTANGVAACASSGDQGKPSLLLDGSGGVFVGWSPGGAQHFDGNGTALWAPNGVRAFEATGATSPSALAHDGTGGVFVGSGQLLGRVRSFGEPAWVTSYRTVPSAADVPGDEGGWASVAFPRPPSDGSATILPNATGYGLWRRQPGSSAAGPARIIDPLGLVPGPSLAAGVSGYADFPPGTWEYVDYQPAFQRTSYSFLGPTHTDSTASGSADEQFLVVTHTNTPTLFVVSQPATGHSVDNLVPGPPMNLVGGATGPNSVRLQWAPNRESDLWHYTVHRGTASGFVPSAANRISQPTVSLYEDHQFEPGVSHYKVAAIDRHGNVSSYAALGPGQIVSVPPGTIPTRMFLGAPAPNPSRGNAGFEYGLPRETWVTLSIFDVHGRRVTDLVDGLQPAGVQRAEWSGRDQDGRPAAAGVYLIRLDARGERQERKLVLTH